MLPPLLLTMRSLTASPVVGRGVRLAMASMALPNMNTCTGGGRAGVALDEELGCKINLMRIMVKFRRKARTILGRGGDAIEQAAGVCRARREAWVGTKMGLA